VSTTCCLRKSDALAKLGRAAFYGRRSYKHGPHPDLALRDTIQRIALEFPSYGRPRITAELRRPGWVINSKKVLHSAGGLAGRWRAGWKRS